jgi:hypothetical protein
MQKNGLFALSASDIPGNVEPVGEPLILTAKQQLTVSDY